MSIIYFLVIGAIAGWLAGRIMKGRGFGFFGNIVVGVVGAILGGHLLGWLGIGMEGGLLGSLATALIGAIVLLFIVGLIKKS